GPATELADALDATASAHRLHVDRDHADRAVRFEIRGPYPPDVRDAVLPDRRFDLLGGETLVPQPVWHERAILHEERRTALQQSLTEGGQTQQADDHEVHHEEHERRREATRQRNVGTDHRVLHGVRDQQDHHQVAGAHLTQLALAEQPEPEQDRQVDDRRADRDLPERGPEPEEHLRPPIRARTPRAPRATRGACRTGGPPAAGAYVA